MKNSRNLLTGLVLSLLAAALVVGYQSAAEADSVNKGPAAIVVVAGRDLPAGHKLMLTDLATNVGQTVPSDSRAASILVGTTLLIDIPKGRQIKDSDLVAKGSGPSIAGLLPTGYRAATVTLREPELAVMLYPGAFVDVLVTMDLPNRSGGVRDAVTRTVVSGVKVVAVNNDAIGSRSIDNVDKKTILRKISVTLAVKPEQAAAIELASSKGDVGIVLRPESEPASNGTTSDVSVTTHDISGTRPKDEAPAAPISPPAPVVATSKPDEPKVSPVDKKAAAPAVSKPWEVTVIRGETSSTHAFPQAAESRPSNDASKDQK